MGVLGTQGRKAAGGRRTGRDEVYCRRVCIRIIYHEPKALTSTCTWMMRFLSRRCLAHHRRHLIIVLLARTSHVTKQNLSKLFSDAVSRLRCSATIIKRTYTSRFHILLQHLASERFQLQSRSVRNHVFPAVRSQSPHSLASGFSAALAGSVIREEVVPASGQQSYRLSIRHRATTSHKIIRHLSTLPFELL